MNQTDWTVFEDSVFSHVSAMSKFKMFGEPCKSLKGDTLLRKFLV